MRTVVLADSRWCIWIDLEGFAARYPREAAAALRALRRLMLAVFRIGSRVYSRDGERLFAHQLGDGLAIISNSHEESLDRCLAIAVALMRDVSSTGFFARAGVAEGDFMDFGVPNEVRVQGGRDSLAPRMGDGLLTTTPVMGLALVSAVKMQEARAKGPLLLCDASLAPRVPATFPSWRPGLCSSAIAIDWVRASSPLIASIAEGADLISPGPDQIAARLRDYCAASRGLSRRWKASAMRLAAG